MWLPEKLHAQIKQKQKTCLNYLANSRNCVVFYYWRKSVEHVCFNFCVYAVLTQTCCKQCRLKVGDSQKTLGRPLKEGVSFFQSKSQQTAESHLLKYLVTFSSRNFPSLFSYYSFRKKQLAVCTSATVAKPEEVAEAACVNRVNVFRLFLVVLITVFSVFKESYSQCMNSTLLFLLGPLEWTAKCTDCVASVNRTNTCGLHCSLCPWWHHQGPISITNHLCKHFWFSKQ